MKKRLLAGLLALTLAFSGSISAAAAEKTIKGNTAESEMLTETADVTEEDIENETAETAFEAETEMEVTVSEAQTDTEVEITMPEEAPDTAFKEDDRVELGTEYVLNPIYESEYTVEDLQRYMEEREAESGTEKKFQAAVYECDSLEDAANALKNEMKVRTESCTITTRRENSHLDIINYALKDNIATAPNEGDYLRANWYGYSCAGWRSSTVVTYEFTLSYVDDAQKEAAVTNMIPSVLSSLNLSGKTEYEKIKTIHDYVCNKITYVDDGSLVNHSTYGALINGQAVCQGYASLFYRLCREAGISNRFITGYGGAQAHAWNIVKLDNYYYNLDATWDDADDILSYDYFLKNEGDFDGHLRRKDSRDEMDYTSDAFYAEYPMAPVSYGVKPLNLDNPAISFQTIDDTTVSSAANGRPKVLIFFSTGCYNSQYTIQSVCQSAWINSKVADVIAVEVNGHSKDEVKAFKNTYGNDAITFCYGSGAFWTYQRLCSAGTTLPLIVYIDKDNKIASFTNGMQGEKGVKSKIDAIGASGQESLGYAITAGAGIGGTITPNGTTSVAAGGSITYTITPASGYGIADVKVDNVSVGAKSSYTFSNVKGNHTISAVFTKVSGYVITASAGVGGTITPNGTTSVAAGGSITYTITPASGYGIADVKVDNVSVGAKSSYTFSNVKGNHTISAVFAKVSAGNPFTDVKDNAYYAEPVKWAVQNNITSGTSTTTFSPEMNCTRGQIVTFLWRAAGSPKPRSANNPFTDIKSNAYYYQAVLWAVEQGITSGTTRTTFSPEATCTRGQAVTFIYRYAGQPSVGSANPFRDVKNGAYYYNPVLWAVNKGVTSGTSTTTFSPEATCTRGQIVTFLYRYAK